MPTITVKVLLTDGERERLQKVLTSNEIDSVVKMLAAAGASEVINQALGAGVFSSMTDLRYYRIRCLLESGLTLDRADALLSVLFKVTRETAKRWVRATVARYDFELKSKVEDDVKTALSSATLVEKKFRIKISSAAVAARILELIEIARTLEPVPGGPAGSLTVPWDTIKALNGLYSLPVPPKP